MPWGILSHEIYWRLVQYLKPVAFNIIDIFFYLWITSLDFICNISYWNVECFSCSSLLACLVLNRSYHLQLRMQILCVNYFYWLVHSDSKVKHVSLFLVSSVVFIGTFMFIYTYMIQTYIIYRFVYISNYWWDSASVLRLSFSAILL